MLPIPGHTPNGGPSSTLGSQGLPGSLAFLPPTNKGSPGIGGGSIWDKLIDSPQL